MIYKTVDSDILAELLEDLEKAITYQDRPEILRLYDEVGGIDFDQVEESLLSRYDELITKGNDCLYRGVR